MNTIVALARRHVWIPPLVVLVLLGAAIGVMRPSTFAMDQINIKIAAAMTLVLIATGQTIVMTRGGIDLSVGGILSLTTAICGTRGDPGLVESLLWVGFVLALGAGVGVLNGLIVSLGKLQPFVVTLATWSILEGCALTVLPAENSGVPQSWFDIEHAMPFGVGVPMIMLALLILFWAWFSRTRVYNEVRAAGSNERSAYLNRVSVHGTNAWAYGLSGFFAAAAGLYFATQTGAGHPTIGTQYLLPAIAAVVIGGTSLMGGRSSLMGTIIGAFILTLIGDVVFLLKLQSYWQWVISGLILMLVVILTALAESRSASGNGS
jgi:ribose transport system permease protein